MCTITTCFPFHVLQSGIVRSLIIQRSKSTYSTISCIVKLFSIGLLPNHSYVYICVVLIICSDLVYKFKKIRGMTDFSYQCRKVIMRYKRIGYYLNVMRQSSCLVINPIKVDGYAALFNCTPVDRASDSMMAST